MGSVDCCIQESQAGSQLHQSSLAAQHSEYGPAGIQEGDTKAHLSVDQHPQSAPPPQRQFRRASPEQSQTTADMMHLLKLLDPITGYTGSLTTVVWKALHLHALLTCVGLIKQPWLRGQCFLPAALQYTSKASARMQGCRLTCSGLIWPPSAERAMSAFSSLAFSCSSSARLGLPISSWPSSRNCSARRAPQP